MKKDKEEEKKIEEEFATKKVDKKALFASIEKKGKLISNNEIVRK